MALETKPAWPICTINRFTHACCVWSKIQLHNLKVIHCLLQMIKDEDTKEREVTEEHEKNQQDEPPRGCSAEGIQRWRLRLMNHIFRRLPQCLTRSSHRLQRWALLGEALQGLRNPCKHPVQEQLCCSFIVVRLHSVILQLSCQGNSAEACVSMHLKTDPAQAKETVLHTGNTA